MGNAWDAYKQKRQQTQQSAVAISNNPWMRYKMERGITASSFAKPISSGKATGIPDDRKSVYEAAQRLSYSLPVEAQASVGRKKMAMTGTELREIAAKQAQIEKDLNTLDLYANKGLTGTERREKQEDLIRAAQKADAEEERERNKGLTGTERLAPLRELEQKKKALEAERNDMYSNPGDYIWTEALTGTERRERGSDYTQRPDLGLEMAKKDAEYDRRIAEIDQQMAEFRAKAYEKMVYEPDFNKYVKIGAEMYSDYRDTPDEGTHFGNRDAELYEGSYSGLDLLTKDEQDKYNYMLGKYGEDVAGAYWKSVLPSAQHKYGKKVARAIQNGDWKTGALIANSLGTGVTNFMAGGLGAFGALTGQEIGENGLNYASQYIKEDLGPVGKVAYDMGVTVGNMLPSILIGGSAGIAAMGISAGGNAYQQGLREGMAEEQAWTYGIAVGVSEACLQKAMGGISRLGGVSDDIARAVSGVEDGILKFVLKTGGSALSEGMEESLQAVLEPIFKAIITGNDLSLDWSKIAYNGLMGILTGGAFEGVKNTQNAAMGKGALETRDNSEYTDINKTKETESLRNGAEEIYIHKGGQRPGSADTGRAISAVEEGTGRNPSGKAKNRPADRETASLTYGKEVSTASLGIVGGTTRNTIRLVTGGDTTATKAARQIAEERGLQVVFFADSNLEIKQKKGSLVSARALISGNRVFVRVDHADYTSHQLMRHEAGHDMIAKGEIDPDSVRKRIDETFGKKKTGRLADIYADAYEGTGMTAMEVWEELICDSLGDMNIFSNTEREIQAWELLKDTKVASAETRTESSRGLPEGAKYSWEKYSGKQVEWAVKNGVLTEQERIAFFHMIANINKLGDKVRRTDYGGYIVDLGNKLLFTDGNWHSPSLSSIVIFNDTSETSMRIAKDVIFNGKHNEAGYDKSRQTIEDAYWPGYVERYTERNSASYARENARRKGADSRTDNGRARDNVKAKYSREPIPEIYSKLMSELETATGEKSGIYAAFLQRDATNAQTDSSVTEGQQDAMDRMLYTEELLKRGAKEDSGIYAEALRKAELEKARKIADESGLKLEIQSLGVNQRGKHENRSASGENSKKPNKSFEDSEKSDTISKLGCHILDIAYISHDLHEMSEQIGAIMDKFSSRFSRWSGNTSIGRVKDMPGVSGRKEWSCDITLREDAEIKTAVHEHLHARSASYYVPTQYRKWHNIEEGAVELYAQEICRQAGINFRESYKEEVKQLKIANSIMQLYDDHFKYAHDLFEIPMPERYAWLRSNANRAINNGRLSKKSIDALNYAIEFFNGRL